MGSDQPRATEDDPPIAESTTGTPRWVKAFGIVALVLVVLVVAILLIGGGGHGPSRHTDGGDTRPAAGHAPPPDGHAL